MQAVILVGGLGTRLRPITYDIPKALVPLRNKPFMGYTLDFLRGGGIEGAVLSLGYLPDPIQRYIDERGDLDGFSVEYAVEERPLGTAGGIKNAARFLQDGPVVVLNGDVLTGMDLRKAIELHRSTGALATITLTSVEDPTAYGLVEVDHDMMVRRFIEKPSPDEVTTNLVNAGVYVLEPEVLEMIPPGREVSIEREIFPRLQERRQLYAHVSSSYWKDIGTPRSYLAASHDVLSGAVGAGEGFDYMDVHRSTLIEKNVRILPPVSVAEGCEISAGATVGGRSSLGRGCRVGEGAVVEGSILLDGAVVEAGAVVRGSIVGPGARIGEGAIVRGLSVLGARCVVGEGNVLDQGIRINPGVVLQPRSVSF
ncbi:Nucleotidyl transferase [Rubrobacter xylanophilus DSM 9941]|uniref:Nucleotidyl transferase n=1 Tax=Rubrobacter xylanophilus (strain DSM 9941 / JCM 11954 / NBRC 16129 / PRD-1) TaxID=266117 RepID=Q1AVJ3_RUBXD|nr:NDP-sugar synthase [Rubrobacter xylanophilus]ABG04585.1 Nucleotidyl transferase [Rubrobacter xylanophilus DSM 9941]